MTWTSPTKVLNQVRTGSGFKAVAHPIILAPVPCVHLASAQQMRSERIAFGTDLTGFFPKNSEGNNWKGRRVLIYASRKSSGAKELFVTGRATFEAKFETWSPAKDGQHFFPEERPPSTLDKKTGDSAFKGFWVVTALKRLPKEQWVAISSLKATDPNQPLKKPYPRKPMLVQN
jgi:hypothetical protein